MGAERCRSRGPMDEESEGRPAGGSQWRVGIGGGGRVAGAGADTRPLRDCEIYAIALDVTGAQRSVAGHRGITAPGSA